MAVALEHVRFHAVIKPGMFLKQELKPQLIRHKPASRHVLKARQRKQPSPTTNCSAQTEKGGIQGKVQAVQGACCFPLQDALVPLKPETPWQNGQPGQTVIVVA